MGILLNSLAPYSGPYSVSTHDVELPSPSPSPSFSLALLKSTNLLALQQDTTLFTLFYPTNSPTKKAIPWLERPLSTTARGYAKFLGKPLWIVKSVVYLLGRSLYLATNGIDRPLLQQGGGEKSNKFPVVVFSHGLSGNRTTYSQYCGELASRGYVVVAIEHRDGSGPVSIVKLDEEDARKEKIIEYIKEADIYYENPSDKQPFLSFRSDQLRMRQSEISRILSTLQRINAGDSNPSLERSNRRKNAYGLKEEFRWEDWKGRLDLQDGLVMAGHSFGGATTIQILRSNEKYRFKKGLALDPWADPIPPAVLDIDLDSSETASSSASTLVTPSNTKGSDSSPAAADPSSSTGSKDGKESKPTISVPFLVINSEAFTLWKPHFYLVRDIVNSVKKKAPSWFFTILGSVHVSFSDIPLFLPSYLSPKPATTPAPLSHSLIVETSLEFLEGRYVDGKHLGGNVRGGDEEYVNPKRGEREKGPLRSEEGEGYVRMHVKGQV
ncbi:hypothetical protein JCM16303_004039 [Sporobolomyces ruberrimus]